jgi:Taurine catabolism dioxygenase TauD, TfdA family
VQTAWHLSSKDRTLLNDRGWISLPGRAQDSHSFKLALVELGRTLGTPAPTRMRSLVDELRPQDIRQANACSLSRITGTGQQPWHMDLAHRPVPARYLVMGMHECLPATASTELLDAEMLINDRHSEASFSEPFLVRTGETSFYATIASKSMSFVRFDPGCMHGATARAKQLMRELMCQNLPPTHAHIWEAGSLLVIDNWKMLHRRADSSNSTYRILYRVSIMGDTS